jgi:hypothetical protein
MITRWTILNKHPFELLPGTPREMPDGDLSYYQYINKRWKETGKNAMCVAWLAQDLPPGLVVDEPFGGCGVFSVVIQHVLAPRLHRIGELDEECVTQLKHALRDYPTARVSQQDAHAVLGTQPADVYVCDFPFFTLLKHVNEGLWVEEMARMTAQKPRAIIFADGFSSRYHMSWKALARRGYPVTADRQSYAFAMDEVMKERYGYHVTGCASHNTCFYIRLEPEPHPIAFLHLGADTGHNGLKPENY